MILIHEKANRGHSRTGWLDSRHTFSFGGFKDPARMGFGNLRVLNEDRVIPGSGFAPHRHESMDILTIVLSGALRHEDNQGNVQTIRAGEAQLMSAGTGIEHAEWNASKTEPAHFLQIWMIPDTEGGAPSYAQTVLPDEPGTLTIAGGPHSDALLPLRSTSTIRLIRSGAERDAVDCAAVGGPDAKTFVQIVSGIIRVEGERLSAGDGLQLPAGETVTLRWLSEGMALVFTMPAQSRL